MKLTTMLVLALYLAGTIHEVPHMSVIAKRVARSRGAYVRLMIYGIVLWPIFMLLAFICSIKMIMKGEVK